MRSLFAASLLALGVSALPAFAASTCNGVTNNLVTNCGFETGTFSGWSGTATTDSPNYTGVDNGDPFTTYKTPYQGTYEAYLGSPTLSDILSQSLTTVAGQSYNVEFALLNDTDPTTGYTNGFQATFGGSTLLNESGVAAGAYTLYSYNVMASSTSSLLAFTSFNDGGYFELDSVSVAPGAATVTPEPSSFLLMGTGLLGALGAARRRLRA